MPLWRRLLTRRRRKFDGYKRSKRPRCAKSPARRARAAAQRASLRSIECTVLSSNSSCDPDVRAHPLCLAEPRSALFMLGALSTSPFLICLSLAPIYARVSSSLGSSSFLLLELPSSSRNIRSRQLYQSANFLIKPLSVRGRFSQEILAVDHHDPTVRRYWRCPLSGAQRPACHRCRFGKRCLFSELVGTHLTPIALVAPKSVSAIKAPKVGPLGRSHSLIISGFSIRDTMLLKNEPR